MARPVTVKSGDLNVPLKVRVRGFSRDASGGPVIATSADSSTLFGSVRPAGAREFERFGLTINEMTHTIIVRKTTATDALGPSDALISGSRVFEVVSKANVDERNVLYEIAAREVVTS